MITVKVGDNGSLERLSIVEELQSITSKKQAIDHALLCRIDALEIRIIEESYNKRKLVDNGLVALTVICEYRLKIDEIMGGDFRRNFENQYKYHDDEIIIPSDLDDEEYKEFLDANFERCPQCGNHLNDEEIHTHDCEIEPKIGGLFDKTDD